ncbi:hypothetical protein TcasGA2_TC034291 [Tribolium castaneum]|uniref:THAP-type domain-containing protein n=1 Tax=Tribolium castaneum TaxID=7070 RepID=A0A139WCA7_TRICA|nr:hypothetical protein TcasGA2_TC034291 [Tribolium castaneum]
MENERRLRSKGPVPEVEGCCKQPQLDGLLILPSFTDHESDEPQPGPTGMSRHAKHFDPVVEAGPSHLLTWAFAACKTRVQSYKPSRTNVRNIQLHREAKMPTTEEFFRHTAKRAFSKAEAHPNPLVKKAVDYNENGSFKCKRPKMALLRSKTSSNSDLWNLVSIKCHIYLSQLFSDSITWITSGESPERPLFFLWRHATRHVISPLQKNGYPRIRDQICQCIASRQWEEVLSPVSLRASCGKHFNRWKKPLTLNELLEEVENLEDETVIPDEIILFPPENANECNTDEDSGKEDNVVLNNLPGSQLRGNVEVALNHEDEEINDEIENWDSEYEIPFPFRRLNQLLVDLSFICTVCTNMARKRGLTRDELEHFANLSESEWEEFLEDNSEDDQNYELSSDASDCSSSENEYDKNEENAELSVDDMDVQQQCPAHTQHISWCETEQDPPQFNFRENSGLQFDSRNLTIESLVDLFFTQEFLDLLVAQTNLNANQESSVPTLNLFQEISVRLDHDYILNEDQIFVGRYIEVGSPVSPTMGCEMSTQTESEIQKKHVGTQTELYELSKWTMQTQTGKELSAATPRKRKLKAEIRSKGEEVKKLRRKLDIANKSLEENEKNKKQEISGEEFKQACDRFLPPQFSKAAQVLSNLKNRKAQGRRFTGEFKQHALGLYFASPKAYRIMVKKYHFPSTHLFYDQKRDEIIGFHDNGKGKEFKPAQNALVLMARGIEENWKQPLAFFFVNSTCNAQDLQSILHECITRMLNIGFTVKAVVSDMGSNFIQLSRDLGITTKHTDFQVQGKTIRYFFDTPHLLKCMRNLLLQNTVHFDGKEASWKFVEQLFNLEKNKDLRMAPKLSEAHIHPTNFQKMKVKYAAQVLSSTVSSDSYKTKKNIYTIVNIVALSTYMAMRTAEFIEKIDHLFDILNSSTQASKNLYRRPYKGTPQQDAFLHEMTQFFKKIRLFRHENR